jgi:Zn-dependent protease
MNLSFEKLFIVAPLFMIFLTLNSAAQAWAAWKCGDDTPEREGRLTVNPLSHLDPIGTVLLILVGFGWGKAVNVDERNFREPKWQAPLVAASGTIANLLLGILSAALSQIVLKIPSLSPLAETMGVALFINAMLVFFGLLPIPPMPGYRIIQNFLPRNLQIQLENMAPYLSIGLLILIMVGGGRVFGTAISTIAMLMMLPVSWL